MELFRHYFTAEEWATSIFFQQHLNDFGFCNMDGSPITCEWTDMDFKGRYKYDPKGEVYISNSSIDGQSYFASPGCFPYLSDNHTEARKFYVNACYHIYTEVYPATVFFIPLINKGFFLHIRTNDISSGNQKDVAETSTDPRDKTFCIDTPTPSLNIRVYGIDTEVKTKGDGNGILNLIGLPPSSGNPNYWTYLLYTRCGAFYRSSPSEPYYEAFANNLIDYGNQCVAEIPYLSKYIRTTEISHENSIYTNTNANVCALIKVPFDTGYIDNLYLLATSPKELTDATFFSFNGRNFLNVFDNYVIELPSTSN